MHLKITKELAPHFKGYNTSGEIILLFVYMKFRFSLSYRDLEEMMTIKGASIDHSTVQRWVVSFSSIVESRVKKRKRKPNSSWRMDETYIKVDGKWMYLYRAVDKYGDTVSFLLRKHRDGIAAKVFFRKCFREEGVPLEAFLQSIPAVLKRSIKNYCCDMNEGYVNAGLSSLQKAKIIIDRFHVSKLYRKTLVELRKRELERLREKLSLEKYQSLKPADKISVDKSGSNKHALDHFNDQLPEEWQYEIRQIKYLNNICEQDHRFIKKRTKPTLGFKSFESAEATLAGIESIRMIQKGQIIGQEKAQSSYNNFVDLMVSAA